MKALSILQPWAWLIVNGYKDVENRDWRTRFRGRFIVHAGKRWGPEQREDLARVHAQFPHIALPAAFDRGGIVGAATMVDCVDRMDSPWFVGEYGFTLINQKPCSFVPWRGQLGFFEIPRDALAESFPATSRVAEDA